MKIPPVLILVFTLGPGLSGWAAPVVVNEFNAVSSSRMLQGGGSDSFFGTVTGNGGDWFELAVVGSGAGSTVDMRGWRLEIKRQAVAPFSADDTVVLSNDLYWASVPAGTILTFTESRAAEGGMDTSLNATDRRATEGWAHSNIWVGDPTLISYTDELTNGYTVDPVTGVEGMNLNDLDTQLQIKNSGGVVLFGPVGEGVAPAGNEISSEEVFALQQTPSAAVVPTSDYGDSSKGTDRIAYSTFGAPNRWSVAGETYDQSFSGFRTGGTPPVFLSSPPNTDLLSGTPFSYAFQSLDADGDALSHSLLQGPAFLNLADNGNGTGQLTATPTAGQAGTYVVKLRVTDNADGAHVQAFVLTVLPSTAPVIVNEYNAVSSTTVLSQDWSFDQRFGRVRGNGDDWIELVVVGNGSAGSTVDLRGWKLEVIEDGEPAGSIALSNDPSWQAVPAGTILTFTESDTAGGGWDTALFAENRLAIEGWAWSNVFLGDTVLLDQSAGTSGLGIVGEETRITIFNAAGLAVAGPFGEGVFSARTVNNTETFRLTADPAPSVSPIHAGYTDADSSTFGHPNRKPENDGTVVGLPAGTATGYQSFAAFATGAASTAPYFTNLFGTPDLNNTVPGAPWNAPLITAADPDHAAASLSFSLVAPPAGINLTNNGNGTANLSWTPSAAQAGRHDLVVRVSDPAGAFLTQTVRVDVMPSSSPVLVNEYNAVSSSRFLNGGTAGLDVNGGTASDVFFGRIDGNGGDWIELVVVGNGASGSTVDMRGWRMIVWENYGPPETVVLSQHPYWSAVQAGTILTFVERDLIAGGLDSAIHRVNRFADLGYAWTNIVLTDPAFVDQVASDFGRSIPVSDDETEFVLQDAGGAVVNGPAGEQRILRNVNFDEVFHLERDPAPGITASVATAGYPNYADNFESSSFGAPNQWQVSGTGFTQSFSAFVNAGNTNSLPTFTQLPTFSYGVPGLTTAQPVQAVDFNGNGTLSLSVVNSPAWVGVTDSGGGAGTVSWTPAAGVSGFHEITLRASDGLDAVERTFPIFVHGVPSTVILNEYNGVSSDTFLNGGTQAQDDLGGTASDEHFARVLGNGGDWLELVVVGNDGPGALDLRGWTIEVAEDPGFPFVPMAVVELSNDPFWAAVPHGTILTLTEERTAEGGLDTSLNRIDRRASEGWSWSNVWIGDSQLLTYTSPAVNGYRLDSVTGKVSDFTITSVRTQFVIKDGSGAIVYGPVGEGIGLTGGIDSRSVWELVGDPRSTVNPHQVADLLIPQFGAAAGDTESTFGHPNRWSGGAAAQDYTVFIAPYDTYVAAAGLSGADALPLADPDFDGLSNLIEYAIVTDPATFTPASDHPAFEVVGGKLALTFVRRKNAPDLVYTVEVSEDLAAWSEITTVANVIDNGDGTETVTVTADDLVVDRVRKFIRLRVTRL